MATTCGRNVHRITCQPVSALYTYIGKDSTVHYGCTMRSSDLKQTTKHIQILTTEQPDGAHTLKYLHFQRFQTENAFAWDPLKFVSSSNIKGATDCGGHAVPLRRMHRAFVAKVHILFYQPQRLFCQLCQKSVTN